MYDVVYANNTFVTVGNNVIINSPDEGDITDYLSSISYNFYNGYPTHNETVDKAFDNSTSTKFYNPVSYGGGAGTTVIIDAGTTYTVSTLGLTTANDMEGRDPTSFSLYGSNYGGSWASIVANTGLNPPDSRYTNYANVRFLSLIHI